MTKGSTRYAGDRHLPSRVSGCDVQVGGTVEKLQRPPPWLGGGPLLADGKPPSSGWAEAAGLPERLGVGALHCRGKQERLICTW